MKIKKLLTLTASVILLAQSASNLLGESRMESIKNISLPKSIDDWKLSGPPARVDESNIFEYMNGAGELYLGYHFDHLSVYEYQNQGRDTITVELYQMKESRDAFGLLSMDWSGEPVELGNRSGAEYQSGIVPPYRALYGKGLLRARVDDLYLRIMANRETPEVKKIVLELGKIIAEGRSNPAPPDFLNIIKQTGDISWKANPERTAYFYSHLVLNSFFYLSHENILNLDSSTEAVLLAFNEELVSLDREIPERDQPTAYLLVIKYPGFDKSSKALNEFFKAYIPELNWEITAEKGGKNRSFFKLEDGWMGYKLRGFQLALTFSCPDQSTAWNILEQVNFD